jgi:hypothetical protein
MTMPTFEEFRATRSLYPDLRQHPELADYYEGEHSPVPGLLYSGGYYIELLPSGEFGLPIENTYQQSNSLDELERVLYGYAEPDLYHLHNRG